MSEELKYRQYRDEESLYTQEYMDHVQAMTAEKLHSKSEIAAELAGRDREITALKRELDTGADREAQLYAKRLESLVIRLVDSWWPFVHGAAFASNTAKNIHKEVHETLGSSKISDAALAEIEACAIDAVRERWSKLPLDMGVHKQWILDGLAFEARQLRQRAQERYHG